MMNRKRLTAALLWYLLLIVPAKVTAGSTNIVLECRTIGSPNDLVVKGDVPGDHADFQLELSANAGVIKWSSENQDNIGVVDALADRVFTVSVTSRKQGDLRLYALPSTIKTRPANRRTEGEGTVASFRAMLVEAPRPGHTPPMAGDQVFRNIKMRCTYRYVI